MSTQTESRKASGKPTRIIDRSLPEYHGSSPRMDWHMPDEKTVPGKSDSDLIMCVQLPKNKWLTMYWQVTDQPPVPQDDGPLGQLLGHASNPTKVRRFCLQHNMADEAMIALRIAQRYFAKSYLKVAVEVDPESVESWLVYSVAVDGKIEAVLMAFDQYTDAIIAEIPFEKSRLIRLNYYFQ